MKASIKVVIYFTCRSSFFLLIEAILNKIEKREVFTIMVIESFEGVAFVFFFYLELYRFNKTSTANDCKGGGQITYWKRGGGGGIQKFIFVA